MLNRPVRCACRGRDAARIPVLNSLKRIQRDSATGVSRMCHRPCGKIMFPPVNIVAFRPTRIMARKAYVMKGCRQPGGTDFAAYCGSFTGVRNQLSSVTMKGGMSGISSPVI